MKELISAEAFLPNDKEIIPILVGLEFFPISGWRVWENPQQNLLTVQEDKTISVHKSKKSHGVRSKDLYRYAHPVELLNKSKYLGYMGRKDLLILLGKDNLIRSFIRQEAIDPSNKSMNFLREVIGLANQGVSQRISKEKIFVKVDHAFNSKEIQCNLPEYLIPAFSDIG